MRVASVISMLAVAIFVGSHLLGRHAQAVRYGLTILYLAGILALGLYWIVIQ